MMPTLVSKKQNQFLYLKSKIASKIDYTNYIALLSTLNERDLIKTLNKLRKLKTLKEDPPFILQDVLIKLTGHDNPAVVGVVLYVLGVLVDHCSFSIKEIKENVQNEFRVQQPYYNFIAIAVHNKDCRNELLSLNLLKDLDVVLTQHHQAGLNAIYNLGYHISLPSKWLITLSKFLVGNSEESLVLLIIAQIATQPESIALVEELFENIVLLLKHQDSHIVESALKCVLSLTLGNQQQIDLLMYNGLLNELSLVMKDHHTLVFDILTNLAIYNGTDLLPFLDSVHSTDVSLIVNLIYCQKQLIPRIAGVGIPILIENMKNPIVAPALLVMIEQYPDVIDLAKKSGIVSKLESTSPLKMYFEDELKEWIIINK